jgi:hypothetical protein
MLPREAQLRGVVLLVLIVTPEAGVEGFTGSGDGGFEPRGLRDDEVGGDPAVGPATDAEFVGIGKFPAR